MMKDNCYFGENKNLQKVQVVMKIQEIKTAAELEN
jgi:hypothetical protein